MDKYKELNENIDTVPIGHRIGLKTGDHFISDLFFEEYVDPVIVVKKNKKKKKYDISNAIIYIYHIDETKEFIYSVKKFVEGDDILINRPNIIDYEEPIDDMIIIRDIINDMMKKIEIMEIVNKYNK